MVSTTFTYLSRLRRDNYGDVVVDTIHVASIDECYVTYVDDEHADNHDHDDYFEHTHPGTPGDPTPPPPPSWYLRPT